MKATLYLDFLDKIFTGSESILFANKNINSLLRYSSSGVWYPKQPPVCIIVIILILKIEIFMMSMSSLSFYAFKGLYQQDKQHGAA